MRLQPQPEHHRHGEAQRHRCQGDGAGGIGTVAAVQGGEAYVRAAVPVRRALPAFAGMGRLDGRPAAGAGAAAALNRTAWHS